MKRLTWKEILKNRIFCVLLVVEVILLAIGIAGLFAPTTTQYPAYDGETFSLKAGTYLVKIAYSASEEINVFRLEDTVNGSQTVRFGDITLSTGDNVEDCELWVLRDTDTVSASVINGGDAALSFQSLQITSTHAGSRIFLFLVFVAACLIDGLFLVCMYDRKYGISLEKKLTWSALVIALLFVCVPCMIDYNLWGDDWGFHLLRVEGLINGLQDGQFPVRIQGNWLRGYGYAVSIFYSDFFIVIPMLFRLIGFTVLTSYRMFLVVINIATLLIAYQCFRRLFKSVPIGGVTAILYMMSAYRMHNIYMRASIGETLAMAFLPVVFYGFYRIFTDDYKSKAYRRNWILLTLGLTGVIQSHVLTCEMLAFCIAILCVILFKRVFRKETFFELVKTVAATLILNLWYLVPFADYLLTGKFNVGHPETMVIKTAQCWGIYPTHSLFLFYGGGTRGGIEGVGMNWTGAFSLGAALMAVLFIWLYLEFVGDMKKSSFAGKGLGRLMFWYTVFLLVLTSCYFPWDALQSLGGIAETLIMSLQFPYRFLSIAGLTASVLAGEILLYLKENRESFYYRGALLLLTGIAFFFNAYQIDNLLNTRGFARVYNKQSMGTIYVSNGEYLPYQADIDLMQPDRLVTGEDVRVEGYEKGQYTLHTDIYVINEGEESFVDLPLLFYKGYRAIDTESGEELAVSSGDNSVVRIAIPAGYVGEIHVGFYEPWYWRLSEICSLLMAVIIVITLLWRKREVEHETLSNMEK
ncbi:MAG: hypothetical protein ACI4TB_09795 [Lachnospiraceae bacterium]